MCLVARAGPCDAESASTQEDDYATLCWQALIQLMRERATSLDAILPVLREKCVERAIARGLVKALARRARRAASERRKASDRASASKTEAPVSPPSRVRRARGCGSRADICSNPNAGMRARRRPMGKCSGILARELT